MPPTPRSAATQVPPLVSEHGRGGGYAPPKKKTIKVKPHTRQVTVKPPKKILVPDLNTASGAGASDPVTDQVNAAQLPQLQAIQRAQAASELAAKNQATTTQGYYAALADTLKGIGPATQSGYSSAAAADSAFGKGFSDGLAHVQSQTQQEGTNLAGISGGAAPPPVSPAGSDALYATGGYIPATTMSREGAAFGAAANMLPATAAGQGADQIGRIGAQQRLDQQGFADKYSDLAAQAPGLRLGFQKEADAAASDAQSQAIALGNQQIARAKAHADAVYKSSMLQLQYIAQTGTDPRTGKLTPKAQLEWKKTMNAINVANNRVTIAQQNANATSDRVGIAQQTADASTTRANTGVTNSQTAIDKARGYWVDTSGNKHVLAGFTQNPDGSITKKDKSTTKWVPGQSVISSVGKMRVDGYTDDKIAAQLKKWHPNWTAAQVAATLKGAPKLFGDMTKDQITQMRAQANSLRTGWTYKPKDEKATITIGGKTYKSGDAIPSVPFNAAVNFLITWGYSRTDATAMLNRFYPKKRK